MTGSWIERDASGRSRERLAVVEGPSRVLLGTTRGACGPAIGGVFFTRDSGIRKYMPGRAELAGLFVGRRRNRPLDDVQSQAIVELVREGWEYGRISRQLGGCRATVSLVARDAAYVWSRFRNGEPKAADPSPQEIRDACEAIRATWSAKEERNRRGWAAATEKVEPHLLTRSDLNWLD